MTGPQPSSTRQVPLLGCLIQFDAFVEAHLLFGTFAAICMDPGEWMQCL